MKLCLKMTGCKNNRYELDQVLLWIVKNQAELVTDESQADFCVINTCTVTHVADKKSRQLVRSTKSKNPRLKTIVFGCAARMQKGELENIDEIDYLLPDLESVIEFLDEQMTAIDSPVARSSAHTSDSPATRSRALVQIQDGCENFCSYCIIAAARGKSKSRAADEIIDEVNCHAEAGFNEVVLTGINIGAYGASLTTKPEESKFAELLEEIIEKTAIPQIRISSLGSEYFYKSGSVDSPISRAPHGANQSAPPGAPDSENGSTEAVQLSDSPTSHYYLNDKLFEVLKNPRICRHIHLSIQSGSDSVLKRMRRNYTVAQMDAVIARLKKDIPGIAITTDIIVGFPEETDAEFEETVDFVKRHELAKAHVFPYSIRKNTVAATMPQVPDLVKKERSHRLQKTADQCRQEFIENQIGTTVSILWESEAEPGVFEGLTDNYIRVRKKGSDLERKVTEEELSRQLLWGSLNTFS